DLLSMIDTWYHSDISDNAVYRGDLAAALAAITARAVIMPSTTDLYFTLADSEAETLGMPNAELQPISSIWGHRAGNPVQCLEDEATLRTAVKALLARCHGLMPAAAGVGASRCFAGRRVRRAT